MDNNFGQAPQENIPELVSRMVTLWEETAKASTAIAHSRRTTFLAYVAEGFSEAQALELIKVF